jgi:uncharacterized membrane protein YwzB
MLMPVNAVMRLPLHILQLMMKMCFIGLVIGYDVRNFNVRSGTYRRFRSGKK